MIFLDNLAQKTHKIYRQEGIVGINQSIDRLCVKYFPLGICKSVSRRISGTILFLKAIEKYENEIGKFGLQKASKRFTSFYKISFEVKGSPPEWTGKRKRPVIFYSNHTALIDPFFYFTLFARNDFRMLGTNVLKKIGKNIGEYVLPLMSKKYATDRDHKLNLWQKIFDKSQGYTYRQIKKMNLNTFKDSISLLQQGYAIGMFPTGSSHNLNRWFPGIGRLISQIPIKSREEVLVSAINITSPSKNDFLRKIKALYNIDNLKPSKVTFSFAKKRTLHDIVASEKDPKVLTELLKKDYLQHFNIPSNNY
jgi:1-acyl-sn-glycerol-3-phosphate acyltransferase